MIRIANRGVLQLPTGDDGIPYEMAMAKVLKNAKKGPKVGQVLPSGKQTVSY